MEFASFFRFCQIRADRVNTFLSPVYKAHASPFHNEWWPIHCTFSSRYLILLILEAFLGCECLWYTETFPAQLTNNKQVFDLWSHCFPCVHIRLLPNQQKIQLALWKPYYRVKKGRYIRIQGYRYIYLNSLMVKRWIKPEEAYISPGSYCNIFGEKDLKEILGKKREKKKGDRAN